MGGPRHNGSSVRFGVFELDLRAGELRKQGVKLKLQEQPLKILQILLEHTGELVTREELQKRIWPDTFVDADHGLYNAVKKLREALGDESGTPRFIETVPKRGYRFIGSVNANGTALPRSRLAIATVIAVIVTGGILLVPRLLTKMERTSASSPPAPSTPKAQQLCLEGRYHADQAYEAVVFESGSMQKSEEEFAKGLSFLEESIAEDPNHVPAYLEMAKAIMGVPPHVDLLPKGRTALIKALSLDEANPEAHLLMANYLWFEMEGGWDEPENHYKRAIQLRPDFPDGHEAYAEYLDDLGRFEDGMKEHQKAQTLDPNTDYLSSSPLTPRPVQLERTKKFLRKNSPSGIDYWKWGGLEFEQGQYSETLKNWSTVALHYGWNGEAAAIERAYVNGGSQAFIKEVAKVLDNIAKERYFPREMLIDAHRYAGDREGTLAWLASAAKELNPVVRHLRSDPRWDPYRSDPRFQAIARDVGLP